MKKGSRKNGNPAPKAAPDREAGPDVEIPELPPEWFEGASRARGRYADRLHRPLTARVTDPETGRTRELTIEPEAPARSGPAA